MANINRREFLRLSSMASIALLSPFSFNQELNAKTINVEDDYKALVCIMLSGGNDSFNMLVPTDNKSYEVYKKSRSNLALDRDELHKLKYKKEDKEFSLHSSMKDVKELFNNKKLSFISNIAPLVKPTTKEQYFSSSLNLPLGLMSHADQLRHWLTSIPNERVNYGIGGRIADIVQIENRNKKTPMNISLAGSNYFQNGLNTNEYAITKDGSVGLSINERVNELDEVLYKNFNNLLKRDYENSFKQTYMNILRSAQDNHEGFKDATKDTKIKSYFSNTKLSQDLKMVAKTIASSKKLGMKRQTFYVLYHGWDHHNELLENHKNMLGVLNDALYEFDNALEELGVSKNVVTFSASDFGRTLTSNGNGTDHAWGGNSIIMGEAIKGGEIFGEYPSLKLGSSLDIGGGVLIPTTSTDELYENLLSWYGIKKESINEILPNLKNFSEKKLNIFKT